jgi:hypothetical protein
VQCGDSCLYLVWAERQARQAVGDQRDAFIHESPVPELPVLFVQRDEAS